MIHPMALQLRLYVPLPYQYHFDMLFMIIASRANVDFKSQYLGMIGGTCFAVLRNEGC